MRSFPVLLLAALALVLLSAIARAEDDLSSTLLSGKVIPTVIRPVPMPFNAVVDEVLVKPGDEVAENTPLIRFHLQDEAERLLQREVTLGAGTEELKGQILSLERELSTLEGERNKTRQLVSSGLGSKQALARIESNINLLKSRIALLRSTIHKNELSFGARMKELGRYFGQPIKEGETVPEEMVLVSPISGYVLSLAPALNPGQSIAAGTAPVQVGQLNPVLIQIQVYEAEINSIHVGDAAIVEIPSLDDRQFKGIVNEISWISTDMSVATPSYYTVEVTVPNPELLLKPGFKAIVKFEGSNSR